MASQQRYGNTQPRLLVPNRGGLMSRPAQQLTVSRPEDGPQRGTEACIGARRLRPPEGALLPHGVQLRSLGSTGQGVGRLGSVRRAVGAPCAHVVAVEATHGSHHPRPTGGKNEAKASRETCPQVVQLTKSRAGSGIRVGSSRRPRRGRSGGVSPKGR